MQFATLIADLVSPDEVFEQQERAKILEFESKKRQKHLLSILNSTKTLHSQAFDLESQCRAIGDVALARYAAYIATPRKNKRAYLLQLRRLARYAGRTIARVLEQKDILEEDSSKRHGIRIQQRVLNLIYSKLSNSVIASKEAFAKFMNKELDKNSRPCRILLGILGCAIEKYRRPSDSSLRQTGVAPRRHDNAACLQLGSTEILRDNTDVDDDSDSDVAMKEVAPDDTAQEVVADFLDRARLDVEPGRPDDFPPIPESCGFESLGVQMHASLEKLVQHNIQIHVNAAEHGADRAIQLQQLRTALNVFKQKFLSPNCNLSEHVKAIARLTCLEITTYMESRTEMLYCSGREKSIFTSVLVPPAWTPERVKKYNLHRVKTLIGQMQLDEQARSEMFVAPEYCLRAQIPLSDAELLSAIYGLKQFAQDLPFNVVSEASSYNPALAAIYPPLIGVSSGGSSAGPIPIRVKCEPRNV